MRPSTKLIIMGAAGRDFHNFNVYWKQREDVRVVCFTAAQIPNIDGRVYPAVLAGPAYPSGIPIYPESQLEALIAEHGVDVVSLDYSDVSHEYLMNEACRVLAAGADFRLLGARHSMLASSRPVIAVCAVRTGCGKSQTTRRICEILKRAGKRIAVVRHPMPYGDLARQMVQRFATMEDMDAAECTIEEREEYEPHIAAGNLVFAGVDYEKILRRAESEADVVVWDGGNNDLPFYQPALWITVADPHRAGHELRYYPGEINFRKADLIIINKVDTARAEDVATVAANAARVNPRAKVVLAESPVSVVAVGGVRANDAVRGKRVLVVEDGPTLTHGEMRYGAGRVAARKFGAAECVDPRPYASGSLREVFAKYPHLTDILPAVGYGAQQIADLEATIRRVPCDVVLIGTPIDLSRVLKIDKPALRVTYELAEREAGVLEQAVLGAIGKQ